MKHFIVGVIMKKLLTLLITFILIATCLVGCADRTTPLANVDGSVSGNGSFAVVKGDYLYFINGVGEVTADNKFGEVEKSALLRVKTADLSNLENANVETVIPKIILSSSYKTGFYMYGDYVYYATPCDDKNNKGEVKSSQTEFHRFNLKTGKTDSKEIAIAKDGATEYRFIENDNKVYLAFTTSETENDTTVKKLVVYETESKDLVFTSEAYSEMLMAEDNSKYIYYTSKGVLKDLDDKQASFDELYRYEVGEDSSEVFLSGAGSTYVESAEREELPKCQFFVENGFRGVTINLIKNTGKLVVLKVTSVDDTTVVSYYGFNTFDNIADLAKTEDNPLIKFKGGSTLLSAVLTSTAYFKALNEIYYVNSETTTEGVCVFNYEKAYENDLKNGVEIINKDASAMSLIDLKEVDNVKYLYLANTADGYYYQINLSDKKLNKINGLTYTTPTEWYAPVVVGKYFISSLKNETFGKYVYVKDMTDIGSEDYNEALDALATLDREKALDIMKTGILNGTAKEEVQAKVDELYPEEESEE